jgi:hypothetical protein
MFIKLTEEQVAQVRGVPKADSVGGIVYPYRDPDPRAQGHLFATKEEHDDWRQRVGIRDANLDQWEVDFFTPGSVGWPFYTTEEENAILARFDAEQDEAFKYYGMTDIESRYLASRLGKTMGRAARRYIADKLAINGFAPPVRG